MGKMQTGHHLPAKHFAAILKMASVGRWSRTKLKGMQMKFPMDTEEAVDSFVENLRRSLKNAIAGDRPAELDQSFKGIPVKDNNGNIIDYVMADHVMSVRFPPKNQIAGVANAVLEVPKPEAASGQHERPPLPQNRVSGGYRDIHDKTDNLAGHSPADFIA
jgi:hypothetical protein